MRNAQFRGMNLLISDEEYVHIYRSGTVDAPAFRIQSDARLFPSEPGFHVLAEGENPKRLQRALPEGGSVEKCRTFESFRLSLN